MRLLGLSRKAFLAVLVGLLALGAGGIAIASGSKEGNPSSDRVKPTTFTAEEQRRNQKVCRGDDGDWYIELKQYLTGTAGPGDERFTGPIEVNQRVLLRLGLLAGALGLPGGTTAEPIGQAFGTVLYKEPDAGRKKGRTKAFVTFLATLEADPSPVPNHIRAEGAFFGDVFARHETAAPLNYGRVMSNFTSQVALDAESAVGQFGAAENTGLDETENTGVLMKGDCGLGFAKEYRKTFRHARGGDSGRGRDDD